MDKLLGQLSWIVAVLFSGKSDQTIVVNVHFEWVKASYKHVDTQVILQTIDQMWIGDVFASQDALFFVDFSVVLNDFDTTTTTCSHRLENPQSRLVPFSLSLECFIVLCQQKTDWSYYKVLWILDTHTVHVSPEKIFSAELRGAWEMVCLLVLVESLDVVSHDVACPLNVEVGVCSLNHVKSGIFARVDHCVVDVSGV